MPGKLHVVMGELSWESLSPDDRKRWNLSPAIPDIAPDFIKRHSKAALIKSVREKIGLYSMFLDLMGWQKKDWGKTPEYLLDGEKAVSHGASDHNLNGCMTSSYFYDQEAARKVLRQFIPLMVKAINREKMEEAALYAGLLAHYIQDGCALGHIFPNTMFYDFSPEDHRIHRRYHDIIDGCDPKLGTVSPALLGTTIPEFIFRLGILGEQTRAQAKLIFFPLLEACRKNNKKIMNKLAKPLLQAGVFQVASLLHTALAIGQNKFSRPEATSLQSCNLMDVPFYNCHPGNNYGQIIKGSNVAGDRIVPLRADLGHGVQTVKNGLGMTSFIAARYLLEPYAFNSFEGLVALSSDYKQDQEADMDVEFFIGLDRNYNTDISMELDYGPGMKRAYSVKLKPGQKAQHFNITLKSTKTLLLAALPGPVLENGREKYYFPHIVVANPVLRK